tara:strand:+ start:8193 stop:8420 length:228 start_codon:yes stop_codon:yes gene_type:complete
MGNTKQTSNQCSCQSSKKSSNKVTNSASNCCTDVTIETSCNVGIGSAAPIQNICITDIQAKRTERVDRRTSRRGR